MTSPTRGGRLPRIALEYPLSLAVFEKYEDAQRAVDTLSDQQFPVENVLIVGTDLKQMERVTGRLTRGRVAVGGLLSGIWLGLFVGLVFSLFETAAQPIVIIGSTMVYGAVFGLVWALIGYQLTGGHRDFTSVSQVVATKYEVLCEHKVAEQGRQILREAGIITPVWTAPTPPAVPVDLSSTPSAPPAPPTPPSSPIA
jgi:hypothetical protein